MSKNRLARPSRIAALAAGALLALLWRVPYAVAGTQNDPVDVTALVNGACVLTSTAPSTITYDPVVTNKTSDVQQLLGTLSLICTNTTTAVWNVDHGLYGQQSGSYYQPRMYSYDANAYTNYTLYQDSGYTKVFGTTSTDGTLNGLTESTPMTPNVSSTINVYIRIPAGQNVPIGTYRDQVDFTVTY